jgi:hypothetical protein
MTSSTSTSSCCCATSRPGYGGPVTEVLSEAVFFSFAEVTVPGSHRAYNAWHQLDHRPENLALDGVRYGERWVRTPACAATSVVADPRLERTHYVNMYWFREPWQASFAQWQELAERSYQWGRRPDTGYAVRPFMGLFRTVRGRAAPRVLVSPDALPFRPARAVQLSVHRFETAHSPATHACLMDAESRRVPDLLAADGVAGVWTFSSISTTLDPSFQPAAESVTFGPSGADAGLFRAELVFIDGPPEQVRRDIGTVGAGPDDAGQAVFRSLLLPITAWEWDWFDDAERPAHGTDPPDRLRL